MTQSKASTTRSAKTAARKSKASASGSPGGERPAVAKPRAAKRTKTAARRARKTNIGVETEARGNFPAAPIVERLNLYMRETGINVTELATLSRMTPKTLNELLSGRRLSMRNSTLDVLLVNLDLQHEWHSTFAPYWLTDAQREQIEAMDDDLLLPLERKRLEREAKRAAQEREAAEQAEQDEQAA